MSLNPFILFESIKSKNIHTPIDPSANVLKLFEVSITRIDDLRRAENNHMLDLQKAELKRIDEKLMMMERHALELREAESKRLDAIREVEIHAVSTIVQQQESITKTFNDRLVIVEKSQYEGKGKESVNDPIYLELLQTVKSLRESRSGQAGISTGAKNIWGYILGAVGVLSFIFTYLTLK